MTYKYVSHNSLLYIKTARETERERGGWDRRVREREERARVGARASETQSVWEGGNFFVGFERIEGWERIQDVGVREREREREREQKRECVCVGYRDRETHRETHTHARSIAYTYSHLCDKMRGGEKKVHERERQR